MAVALLGSLEVLIDVCGSMSTFGSESDGGQVRSPMILLPFL